MNISIIVPMLGAFSLAGMAFLVWRRWPVRSAGGPASEWEKVGLATIDEVAKTPQARSSFLAHVVGRVRALPWERYEEWTLARAERILVFSRRQVLKLDARTAKWIEKIRRHRNETLNGNHTAPIWEEMREEKGKPE